MTVAPTEEQASFPPAWLQEAAKKPGRFPTWIPLEKMPKVHTRDFEHLLDESHLKALVAGMKKATEEERPERLEQFLELCDPKELAKFVWAVEEEWRLRRKGKASEIWALWSVGYLGQEEQALALAKVVHKWPYKRAERAMQVYRMMGNTMALMVLSDLSNTLKRTRTRVFAKDLLAKIAQTQGLTYAELGDTLVPTCGFNALGKRVFDYGQREFELTFDEHMNVQVWDPGRDKALKSLPKASKGEQEAHVESHRAAYRALVKQLPLVMKSQAERLEYMMMIGRRWSPERFQEHVVLHPLLRYLAQGILWGVYEEHTGALLGEFMVDQSGDWFGLDDEPVNASSSQVVGIVHKVELEEGLLSKWQGQMAQNEVIQAPIRQFSRPCSGLGHINLEGKVLDHLTPYLVKAAELHALSGKGGRWVMEHADERADQCWLMSWDIMEMGLRVWLELNHEEEGLFPVPGWDTDKQVHLPVVHVQRLGSSPGGRFDATHDLCLGEVPGSLVSELVVLFEEMPRVHP